MNFTLRNNYYDKAIVEFWKLMHAQHIYQPRHVSADLRLNETIGFNGNHYNNTTSDLFDW